MVRFGVAGSWLRTYMTMTRVRVPGWRWRLIWSGGRHRWSTNLWRSIIRLSQQEKIDYSINLRARSVATPILRYSISWNSWISKNRKTDISWYFQCVRFFQFYYGVSQLYPTMINTFFIFEFVDTDKLIPIKRYHRSIDKTMRKSYMICDYA